jgi:IS605 OrfB family transposase
VVTRKQSPKALQKAAAKNAEKLAAAEAPSASLKAKAHARAIMETVAAAKSVFGEANENGMLKGNPWLFRVPKDIRQQAAFELHKNWTAAKKASTTCNVKTKAAMNGEWTIGIENSHVHVIQNGKIRLYSDRSSSTVSPATAGKRPADEKYGKHSMKLVVRTMGELPPWLTPAVDGDEVTPPCQVQLQKCGKSYYMLFPHEIAVKKEADSFSGYMAGLDPGVRKFMTLYGTDGRVGFFGSKNPVRKFKSMEWWKDLIRSKLQAPQGSIIRATGVKRRRLRDKFARIQTHLDNIRRDFHHKLANWLTQNYKCIMIGKLPKGIISRDRSLPKVVKRAYNNLAHYKFRCCLKEKCIQRGVVYQEINESYTSKTCTCCGRLNDVGSSETYQCATCRSSWDRDINGARNILLKSISGSYPRIVLKEDETLSLRAPMWTQHPLGYSLALNILQER